MGRVLQQAHLDTPAVGSRHQRFNVSALLRLNQGWPHLQSKIFWPMKNTLPQDPFPTLHKAPRKCTKALTFTSKFFKSAPEKCWRAAAMSTSVFFPTWFVKNIARSLQADTKFWLNNFVTIHFLSFLPATHCHLVQCPRLSVRATWKSDNSTWHTVTPYQRKQNKSPLLHASLTSSFYCQRRDPTNEKGCRICTTKVNHSMARNNAGGKNDKMAQKKYDDA